MDTPHLRAKSRRLRMGSSTVSGGYRSHAPFLKPLVDKWLNGRARRLVWKVFRFLKDRPILKLFDQIRFGLELRMGIVFRIAILVQKEKQPGP